ncbi:MAG: hepT [Bacillales bacterium]|jgi:heptaprenyl diphosphate synthase|nr:hepT [Bacillales bacterium]
MIIPLFISQYKKDISIVEKQLGQLKESQSKIVRQSTQHLFSSGGKRIRPIFGLLCAQFGNYDIHKIKYPAAVIELIHSASLTHDDVIDVAEMRRGVSTIGFKWNNQVATFTGNYILAHSLLLLSKIDNPLAHKILANAIVEVCLGELDQIRDKYDFEQNIDNYLKRIERKTAILIAVAGQLGAVAADVPDEIHQKLYNFGYNVGMSYQIIDDILDFTATEKELGKPAGCDLHQGNITLPVLFAMENSELKARIQTVHKDMLREELVPILDKIRQSDAIERAYKLSQEYLQKALDILEELPKNKHRRNLVEIAKYLGKRKY